MMNQLSENKLLRQMQIAPTRPSTVYFLLHTVRIAC